MKDAGQDCTYSFTNCRVGNAARQLGFSGLWAFLLLTARKHSLVSHSPQIIEYG